MANAIILMTALVPTIGHKYLIDFAKNLIDYGDKVHVILGSLSQEPVSGISRYMAFVRTYQGDESVAIHHLSEDLPQEPEEHPDFWRIWADAVRRFVDVTPTDYFVASELYGINMAETLGCKFMPCNRYRETIQISGTQVRKDLLENFEYILPEFQKHLRKIVTIFGAESCGKTTMARYLSREFDSYYIPEWAREYLETVGSEITQERMRTIVKGQDALQNTAKTSLFGSPFIFQDTDLFSTLGYYRLWGNGTHRDLEQVELFAKQSQSDLYIVMNDSIPFEEDQLRYGINKRESSTDFWVNLLKEYNLPYYVVTSTDLYKQRKEVANVLIDMFDTSHRKISEYERKK